MQKGSDQIWNRVHPIRVWRFGSEIWRQPLASFLSVASSLRASAKFQQSPIPLNNANDTAVLSSTFETHKRINPRGRLG